jgi:DNA glycosylase AlkZ-like
MTPPRVSWAEASARRLERHGLLAAAAMADAAEAAAAMCGAHAQVMSAAEQSVAMRVEQATRADVRTALWERRSIARMHGPRGTVHLLPTAALPMWVGALGSLPVAASPFAPAVRLTPEQADQVLAAIRQAVADAELTIDELDAAVVDAAGPWAGELVMPAFQGLWPRWRQVLKLAGHRGLLCFGPGRGRTVTYTSPRRWLPGFEPLDAEIARAQLVRSYLHAYGPATAAELAQWLGVPRGFAGTLFRSLARAGAIEEVVLGDEARWVNAGDTAFPSSRPRGVRLLPYFDAYVVGGRPRELLYPGCAADRALVPSGQAGNYPVLLIDGVVAGVWHQRRSGRRLHVTVEPLAPLGSARRAALAAEVERLGAILEAAPELTVGPVASGPHA